MRLTLSNANSTIVFALAALPVIWWGPAIIVAGIGLLSLVGVIAGLVNKWPAPRSGRSAEEILSDNAQHIGAMAVAIAFAALAVQHGVSTPALSVKVALTSLLLSRVLPTLLPSTMGAVRLFTLSHLVALLATLILAGAIAAPLCLLWQAVWFAADVSRITFVHIPSEAAKAPPREPPAPETAAPPAPEPSAAQAPTPASNDEAPTPAPQPAPIRKLIFANVARALAASAVIAAMFFVATYQQRVAATPDREEAALGEKWWNAAPWTAPSQQRPPPPAPAYGTREWACAEFAADPDDALHTLTAQETWPDDFDAGWAPAVMRLPVPEMTLASAREANAAFGAPCEGTPEVRVLPIERLRAAPGFRAELPDEPFAAIGRVFAIELSDGRRVLVARGHIGRSAVAGYLLMSWASNASGGEAWIVSHRASENGLPGVLLAPADQPLGGDHLWFAAMGADGLASVASADIIDMSGAAPRNTGALPIWGASICGQTPGDLLYPAEEGCFEHPAWAFWLTDFSYAPGGSDEVIVTWQIRRQFGRAGPPAAYGEPFEDTARGRFVHGSGRWRFVDGEGDLISDREFRLALSEAETR